MGQLFDKPEKEPALNTFARNDRTGQRRLSVITLKPGQQDPFPDEKMPPTVTKQATRTLGDGTVMEYYAMSCSGTYAPSSYKENQDDFFAYEAFGPPQNDTQNQNQNQNQQQQGSLFCVMDGHGVMGRQASSFVNRSLSSFLSSHEILASNPRQAMREAFLKAQDDLESSRIDTSCSGTTCVMTYLIGNHIICGNAGDSRAVLGFRSPTANPRFIELSDDHKPDLPLEKQRIEQSGGRVDAMRGPHNEPIGPARVWVARDMYPGLAMSRSIGDDIAQSVGVSCEPEFKEHDIDFSQDAFLILASDGVWEFIESHEAASLVAAQNTPEAAARMLCKESLKRWADEEDVCDDITALVVFFRSGGGVGAGSVETGTVEGDLADNTATDVDAVGTNAPDSTDTPASS